MKLEIRKSVLSYNLYYFCSGKLLLFDSEIADMLKITLDEYRRLMVKQHNAILERTNNIIMFKNKDNAKNALDHINALIIANKLKVK